MREYLVIYEEVVGHVSAPGPPFQISQFFNSVPFHPASFQEKTLELSPQFVPRAYSFSRNVLQLLILPGGSEHLLKRQGTVLLCTQKRELESLVLIEGF